MKYIISLFITLTLTALFWPEPAWTKEDIVRPDNDKDGKIDGIAHLDEHGKIIKLEIDSNADGAMDRFPI